MSLDEEWNSVYAIFLRMLKTYEGCWKEAQKCSECWRKWPAVGYIQSWIYLFYAKEKRGVTWLQHINYFMGAGWRRQTFKSGRENAYLESEPSQKYWKWGRAKACHWHRLPREVMDSPLVSLDTFTLVWMPFQNACLEKEDSQILAKQKVWFLLMLNMCIFWTVGLQQASHSAPLRAMLLND